MSKISVIVPCYNDGIYLPELIDCLRQQTFKDFEVIIINDGSTEAKTLSILLNITETSKDFYFNIRVIHQTNIGLSGARNTGITFSNSPFIATLDADDLFAPTFFEKALKLFDDEKIGVVGSFIEKFGTVKEKYKMKGGTIDNFLIGNQCHSAALTRKAVFNYVRGYDTNMKHGLEDWEFYLRVLKAGYQIHIIPEYLTLYRQTEKSMYANTTQQHRKQITEYIINKHSELYLQRIASLIAADKIINVDTRAGFNVILKLLKNRLTWKPNNSTTKK